MDETPITVICIGCGPSLSQDDVSMAVGWRDGHTDSRKIIAVNLAFRMAPTADVVHACDQLYWDTYGIETLQGAPKARKTTFSPSAAKKWGAELFDDLGGTNSGYQAIKLAADHLHANRIILLGYDYQATGGRNHFHQDHPAPLYNTGKFQLPELEDLVARLAIRDIEVVNASRETAIDFIPRATLYDLLWKPVEYRAKPRPGGVPPFPPSVG
jgi:hypothetical protein